MAVPAQPEQLSPTELEILRLVATGMTNREIARTRGISEATVKKHVTNVNIKLGTGNRTEAMRRALEMGLVEVATPPTDRPDSDAARRLATELERTRHRSRRVARASALAAALAIALAAGAVLYTLQDRELESGGTVPTPIPVPSGPLWVPAPSLPSPRRGLALSEADGYLFAMGGRGENGVLDENLSIRHATDGSGELWQTRAPKPIAVEGVQAEVLHGRIVVPGGCTESGVTDVVEAYEPLQDEWSALAALPAPRCGYGLAASEGRVYLFGGRSGAGPESATDTVWRYDDAAAGWVAEESMPRARSNMAAVTVRDGEIHLLGGLDAEGAATTDHWVFKPNAAASVRWDTSAAAALPDARASMAAAFALDHLYVVGGGIDQTRDAIFWDPVPPPGSWHSDRIDFPNPGPPVPQQGAAMVASDAKTLVIMGGESAGDLLLQGQYTMQLHLTEIFIPGGRP